MPKSYYKECQNQECEKYFWTENNRRHTCSDDCKKNLMSFSQKRKTIITVTQCKNYEKEIKQSVNNIKSKKIFCNNSCAATFNNKKRIKKEKSNKKTSSTLQGRKVGGASYRYLDGIKVFLDTIYKGKLKPKNIKYVKCKGCEKNFKYKSTRKGQHQQFCSKKCVNENPHLRNIVSKNLGGLRPKSGYGKIGHYKGIYCNSTYELVFLIYNLDHKIPIQRYGHFILREDGKKYYPDFIINKKLFEIKGYDHKNEVDIKVKAAIDSGFDIEVLYKKDIEHCFSHVKNNY